MTAMIPLCLPSVGPGEEEAVIAAIRSGWIAPMGPQLEAFEARLAELTDRPSVVAVSSGTAALHLALLAAGVGEGDTVAVSTLTFAATANAVAYTGAQSLFIDCDDTGLMSADLLAQALANADRAGHPITAIIVVDLYGRPADHPRICALAKRHGAKVIADAAESLGAELDGRPAGSFGDFAALSFNGNKIVTASSGGAVLCRDPESADQVRYLATQARQPVLHYEHTDVGFNYRLSNILAALGLAQLARLPEILVVKRAHHLAYQQMADEVEGIALLDAADGNCWLSILRIDPGARLSATELGEQLLREGIETRPVFKPMHLQPVNAGCSLDYISGRAQEFYATGLALPSSVDLRESERSQVIAAVRRLMTSVLPSTPEVV